MCNQQQFFFINFVKLIVNFYKTVTFNYMYRKFNFVEISTAFDQHGFKFKLLEKQI